MFIILGCLTPDSQCKAPGTEWDFECQHYRCIEKDFERVKEARIQKIGKLPSKSQPVKISLTFIYRKKLTIYQF